MPARRHPEVEIQIGIVRWLRTVAPGLIVHHSPNGELRDKRTAAKLKAMGVYPGWPDLALIDEGGRHYFLEVKAQAGRLSESQNSFRDKCFERGIHWASVRSIDDVRAALSMWQVKTREAA